MTAVQVDRPWDWRDIQIPSGVPTSTVSPSTATPVTALFVNGDGFTPSGIAPETWRPSQSASPFGVPIHMRSPSGVSTLMLSDGRPSNAFTSDHDAPSADSRETPLPFVPTHSRPERSNASTLRSLLASPPGERSTGSNVPLARR